MRKGGLIARIAAVAAIVAAVVVVAVVFLGSGSSYTMRANFQNAGQLVNGDLVQVSGVEVGKVKDISITRDGQAQITFSVDGDYAPLRQGTIATVRQASLSGIANRYINLDLPSHPGARMPSGSVIGVDHTVSAVDLDQIFDTFGPTERDALGSFFRGEAATLKGKGQLQNAALHYLNPALISSARLFSEIDRNRPQLRRFLRANAGLVSDLASKRVDLANLVTNLSTTTGALARKHTDLALAIHRLPPFLRRADTTFVNLRTTLNVLKPLVDESKPVAIKLRPFLGDLRTTAANAQPTIHDLRFIVRRPGPGNDLIELTNTSVPVRNAALGSLTALCLDKASGTYKPLRRGQSCAKGDLRRRPGAFQSSTAALNTATPELAYGRPYSSDLTGWFNDFSDSGLQDAVGGFSRAALNINLLSLANSPQLPDLSKGLPLDLGKQTEQITQILNNVANPNKVAQMLQAAGVQTRQNNRCPGSVERTKSADRPPAYPGPDFNCNPNQYPLGK